MLNLLNKILSTKSNKIICKDFHAERKITLNKFVSDITYLANTIQSSNEKSWLLFSENSYRFLVGLMALLVANKTIIICANKNVPWLNKFRDNFSAILTDEKIKINNIEQLNLKVNPDEIIAEKKLPTLSGSESIIFFTSGSTGEPKEIKKSLLCLTNEISVLENTFPTIDSESIVLSSVSHLHIYGLLFKLLWPLLTGRVWVNSLIEYPEQIVELGKQESRLIFISSPALLSRLDLNLPPVSPLIIFSSGGLLSYKSAIESKLYFGVLPTEIYGSTETGGIAWRQQTNDNTVWTLIDDVKLNSTKDGIWLESLHLCTQKGMLLDDHLELISEKQFLLKGRKDSIIKIEEKRVSLTEIEKFLKQLDTINDCKSLLITGKRDVIGCAIVLSEHGRLALKQMSTANLVKIWKTEMRKFFEPVTIPRKWRILNEIPVNAQSKVDTLKIMAEFG